ncbi:helix-turn-helix domain-containing protein [Actinomadura sp. GTD37]|uniref:helix-turn-helix domain-containing protein n=1 Tax=Actinomadura sp. GTD37 TaxID=1778030 RepID=UPI0035C15C7F
MNLNNHRQEIMDMTDIHASGYSPTIKKRALSRKLVDLRKQCGMTTAQVCRQLTWSHTKLNYIEKAKWVEPNSDAVADLCELYGVEGSDREALITLTREARQRGWWRKYNDVFVSELPGFEAGASSIQTFQNTVVPGLLQVPSYVELITRANGYEDEAEIKRRVDARLERQKILTRGRGPCRLHAIIDENAILRINNAEVRAEQLLHLIHATDRRNIDLQILRIADGVYREAGEVFTYLTFPDSAERDIVYLETSIDNRMLEETDELERYMVRFDRLRAAALDSAQTRVYLAQQLE